MKDIKVIGTASEMSNLVGMPLTGEPNVAKLMNMKELRKWVIVPTKKIADQINEDYYINGWRYSIPF